MFVNGHKNWHRGQQPVMVVRPAIIANEQPNKAQTDKGNNYLP